jgi:hypothetical protein
MDALMCRWRFLAPPDDVVVVGEGLADKGFAAQDPPPARDEIEPGDPHWDEGVPGCADAQQTSRDPPTRAYSSWPPVNDGMW